MATIDEILAVEAPSFARAVKAIITGDVTALCAAVAANPELVCACSVSGHHATLAEPMMGLAREVTGSPRASRGGASARARLIAGSPTANNGKRSRPLRLEAQDTALSRRQHRFESGRGRQSNQ